MLPHEWRTLLAQLSRYWIVSGLAMALDWTIFLTLIGAALRPAAAGVLGYLAGLGLHYVLSVRSYSTRPRRKRAPPDCSRSSP
jgi:putative flippase GtrA